MSEENSKKSGDGKEGIQEEQAIDNLLKANDESNSSNDAVMDTELTSAITHPKSDIQDMEVHHHSHAHGKKNWKTYVWEFLMLFLAVFCGFLAEYQLEHKIERDRAKELAKSLYEELKNDSAVIVQKTQNRIKQENALEELGKYFKDSSITHVSKNFALNFSYGINFRSPSLFEPRTVVLEQLKNSGSLRYFKSEKLQKLIGELSVAIHNIQDRQELESQVRMQFVNPLIIKHYDYDFDAALTNNREMDIFTAMSAYEKSDRIIPFTFRSPEKFDKQEAINIVAFYGRAGLSSTRRSHFLRYTEVNAALLDVLRKEYHLD